MIGICYFAVEMRFQSLARPSSKAVSGEKHREGLRRGSAGRAESARKARLGVWAVGFSLTAGRVCWFGFLFLFLIYFIMINYASHNIYQFKHKFMNL